MDEQTNDGIESGTETAAGTVPEWAVDEDGLRFGEEKLPFDEAKRIFTDFRNDTSWKARNTQEAQRLAEERRGIEKARQLEEWLTSHPEAYGEVEGIFKKHNGQVTGQMGQIPPEVQKELSEIRRFREDFESERAYKQLESDLGELKNTYKEDFADGKLERELVKYAMEHDMPNIKLAFKDMMFDKMREKGMKEGQAVASEAMKKRRGLSAPVGSTGASKGKDPSKMSPEETRKAMVEMVENWNGE